MHEEIVKAKKDGIKRKSESMPGSPAPIAGAEPTGAAAVAGREDEWLEVGKGGAKAVVNAPDPQRRVADSSVVRVFVCLLRNLCGFKGGRGWI